MNKYAVLQVIEAIARQQIVPVDAEIISKATEFILAIPDDIIRTPIVVPMTRGRMQFEWHNGNRSLELEFESVNQLHYLIYDIDIEDEGIIDISNVRKVHELLWWLSETTSD